jgi:hypothetical protein
LAAVGFVVVTDGVDLAQRGLDAGVLGAAWLDVMGGGGSPDLRGAAIVEVLEATGCGEVGFGARTGEANQGVGGGAATEESGEETGDSKGGYFEETTCSSSGLSGGHSSVLQRRNSFKMQGFRANLMVEG